MLSQEALAALHAELTTDPEGLGYTGAAGGDHALLVQQRSYDPQQWLNPDVAPKALAGLLIERGTWAAVAGAVTTNTKARLFHEAAHLDISAPYDKAAAIVTGLVGDGVLTADDATALQTAFRPERTYARNVELGLSPLTIQDVGMALEYEPEP